MSKSVRFSLTAQVMLVEHVNDMKRKTLKRVWYTNEEYESFRDDCLLVAKLQSTGDPAFSQTCIRGLECIVDKDRENQRRSRRREAMQLVLEEQYQQQVDRIYNADWIADGYRSISRSCHYDAHRIGLQDYQEAIATIKIIPPPEGTPVPDVTNRKQLNHRIGNTNLVTLFR